MEKAKLHRGRFIPPEPVDPVDMSILEDFVTCDPPDIDDTLQERQSTYGEFYEQARITQNLKIVMEDTLNWDRLTPAMKEALHMTASKIARILNGDPNYRDSWYDIIGYIKLVEKNLGETHTAVQYNIEQ